MPKLNASYLPNQKNNQCTAEVEVLKWKSFPESQTFQPILTLRLKIVSNIYSVLDLIIGALKQRFPTCGTRKLSKWYARYFSNNAKKSICFHRNSHPEKCSNVNLAPVHFLLLVNCNTYTLNIYIYV